VTTPEEQLCLCIGLLEDARHRAGVARRLLKHGFYPADENEGAAMDALILLLHDVDTALCAARVALNGNDHSDIPF